MAPSSSPPPRRAAVLLLLSLLVVLSAAVSHAAATSRRSHAELHDGQHRDQVDEQKHAGTFVTSEAADEGCGGGGGGGGVAEGEAAAAESEECLMRRTLAAHTDYIYTQGGGHN